MIGQPNEHAKIHAKNFYFHLPNNENEIDFAVSMALANFICFALITYTKKNCTFTWMCKVVIS